MNSYGQNPLCRKSREIRNYCFSFNYALLKVIVAFSFNYAFLRTIVVFTDCIKLVVLFQKPEARSEMLRVFCLQRFLSHRLRLLRSQKLLRRFQELIYHHQSAILLYR